MLNRDQKKNIVQNLGSELTLAKGVVFTSFQGLATKDIQELRGLLRKENIKHKVVKITLIKRALQVAGIKSVNLTEKMPLAISYSLEDEIAAAKIINTFAKTHENLKIVSGILDKKLLDAAAVKHLASLPGKQELLSQLVGTIGAPLRGLVTVFTGNIRGLINVLNAKMKMQSAK